MNMKGQTVENESFCLNGAARQLSPETLVGQTASDHEPHGLESGELPDASSKVVQTEVELSQCQKLIGRTGRRQLYSLEVGEKLLQQMKVLTGSILTGYQCQPADS